MRRFATRGALHGFALDSAEDFGRAEKGVRSAYRGDQGRLVDAAGGEKRRVNRSAHPGLYPCGETDGKDAGLALLRDIAITKTHAALLTAS